MALLKKKKSLGIRQFSKNKKEGESLFFCLTEKSISEGSISRIQNTEDKKVQSRVLAGKKRDRKRQKNEA